MDHAYVYPPGDNEQAGRGQGPGVPPRELLFCSPCPPVLASGTHLAGPRPSEKPSQEKLSGRPQLGGGRGSRGKFADSARGSLVASGRVRGVNPEDGGPDKDFSLAPAHRLVPSAHHSVSWHATPSARLRAP